MSTRFKTSRIAAALLLAIGPSLAAAPPALAVAPANDDFANAQVVTGPLPILVAGTNEDATVESGEPGLDSGPAESSVWFSWTPNISQTVVIDACGLFELSPRVGVYSGDTLETLTPVGVEISGDCELHTRILVDAVAGTTYRIVVDGWAGVEGDFELRIRPHNAPANDDFANAEALSGALPIVASGTNVDATAESGEPFHEGDGPIASVWYSWTPAASATVIIEACEGPLNARLGVYTGDAVDALTEVGIPIDPPPTCAGFDPQVRLDATAGTTYRIAIDGYVGAEASFALRIRLPEPPANDLFGAAQALGGPLPITAAGTNLDATKELGEPLHAINEGGSSVWYAWTADATGMVAVDRCDADFPTLLGVYTGDAVGSLVDVSSGFGFGGCDAVLFEATAGSTYRIALDGVLTTSGISQGTFSLEIRSANAPPNDDFAAAEVLSGSPTITVSGTNVDATKEPGEPDHAGYPGGASVWYAWTPAVSETITIDTCGSDFDTILAVYTGDSVGSLTEIASNDDHPYCNVRSVVSFEATAGTNYRIAVDGFFGSTVGATGMIVLEIAGAPANDDFDDPEVLDGPLPITVSGTTALATKEPGEPDHAGNVGGHSVWYSWTPTVTGSVAIDTCAGEDTEVLLAVYTGDDLASLSAVASNHWGCFLAAFLTVDVVAGTTYRIAVDSYTGFLGSSFGPFTLQIHELTPPENDDFANAEPLTGPLPIAASGTNVDATLEPGEPDHWSLGSASVWYHWTADMSGPVAIDTCGSDYDTLLAVYTGATLGSLTQVGSNNNFLGCLADSLVSFDATAGSTYWIAVDGLGRDMGQIVLHIRPDAPPVNDAFADALPISAPLPISVEGSTMAATIEPGEPDHAGNGGSGSVWYAWTADRPGPVVIDTCAATFDTLLAIYRGDDLGALTLVAASDDHETCQQGSLVAFDAAAGETYMIAIDGWSSGFFRRSTGYFDLVIQSACSQTIRGLQSGTLKASNGITCLDNASIEGAIRVDADASLWALDANVVGPVTAEGAAKVVMCGSTIEGPVRLSSGAWVTLGDPALGCAPNDVDGPVTVTGTSGPSVIAGNHISGKLACTGNEPPPVNRDVPNIVLGPATGQCKDL